MFRNTLPRIKPYFSVITHSPDHVELRSGVWNTHSSYLKDDKLTGKLAQVILAIDGSSSAGEIAKKCDISRSELEALFDDLYNIGALEFGSSSAFDYYIECSGSTLKRSYYEQGQLLPKYPLLIGGDEALINHIIRILTNSFGDKPLQIKKIQDPDWKHNLLKEDDWLYDGLSLEEKLKEFYEWKGSFIILAFQNIDPNLASRLNRIAFHLNISWIHIAIDGPFLFIGPLFNGNIGPCYDCFEKRISMNLREYKTYQSYKEALVKNTIVCSKGGRYENMLMHLIASHASMEIMNYILTGCSFVKNKVLSIYLPSMEISFGEVLKLSNCVTCGSTAKKNDKQLYFDYDALIQDNFNT